MSRCINVMYSCEHFRAVKALLPFVSLKAFETAIKLSVSGAEETVSIALPHMMITAICELIAFVWVLPTAFYHKFLSNLLK